jgi:hypothetical protein
MRSTVAMQVLVLASVIGPWSSRTAQAEATSAPVTIESNSPNVTLEQITGETSASAWGVGGSAHARETMSRTACTVPCIVPLERNTKYFISGRGVHDSSTFVLPIDAKVLKVKAGSETAYNVGLIALTLGGIAAGSSVAGFITGQEKAAVALIAIGGGVAIGGTVLMLMNLTDVETEIGRDLALKQSVPRLGRGLAARFTF